MQIDDRQFEKTIQSKLAGHEADVRGDLWAAIESKLPQNAPQIATRRVPLYRRIIAYSAAAAAVGIVVAVVWWQTPEKPLVTPIANQLSTEGVEMVQPATNDSEQPLIAAATQPQTTHPAPRVAHSKRVTAPETQSLLGHEALAQPANPTTPTQVVAQPEAATSSTAAQKSNNTDADYRRKLDQFENDGRELKESGLTADESTKRKGSGIQIGVMAANATTDKSQNTATAIRTKTPMLLSRRNPVYHFEHRMPISAGITISKTLPKNWELESGLVYTYLYSKYSSTNGNGSQELHYLGIPLNAVYRFARIKRLSFYAAAGGQVDFYLAGRQKDEGYDKGISGSGYKELKHENVQFSVQANLGAALTLYKQTELYLEPYMAYYFENKSEIHNIWKDKPFNFGLTFGIRTGF